MILTCPKCATRYLVDPVKLAPDGRQVRCARCSHDWWAELTPEAMSQMLAQAPVSPPPAEAPAPEPQPEPPPEPPVAAPDQPAPEQAAPEQAGPDPAATEQAAPEQAAPEQAAPAQETPIEPPPVFPPADDSERGPRSRSPRQANLPALFEPKRRFGILGVMVVLAVILAIFNVLVIGQKHLSALWPPLEPFYAAIGLAAPEVEPVALELHDVRTSQTSENGIPILVVTGEVRNPSDRRVNIPEISLTLRDGENRALISWSAKAVADAVGAQGSVPFSSRLENPPEGVRNLEARISGPDLFATPEAPATDAAPQAAPQSQPQPEPQSPPAAPAGN